MTNPSTVTAMTAITVGLLSSYYVPGAMLEDVPIL